MVLNIYDIFLLIYILLVILNIQKFTYCMDIFEVNGLVSLFFACEYDKNVLMLLKKKPIFNY